MEIHLKCQGPKVGTKRTTVRSKEKAVTEPFRNKVEAVTEPCRNKVEAVTEPFRNKEDYSNTSL